MRGPRVTPELAHRGGRRYDPIQDDRVAELDDCESQEKPKPQRIEIATGECPTANFRSAGSGLRQTSSGVGSAGVCFTLHGPVVWQRQLELQLQQADFQRQRFLDVGMQQALRPLQILQIVERIG